jgi:hypothetical protein
MNQSDETAVYKALVKVGDQGMPLASIIRLVGAKRASELLSAMGQRLDFERRGNRFYLRDV